jgi:ketosteroid isomerase-like protein
MAQELLSTNKAAKALQDYLKALSAKSEWTHLWEKNATLTFPFATTLSAAGELVGIEAIQKHIDTVMADVATCAFDFKKIHPLADPKGAVLEFEMHATIKSNSKNYDQKYVGIVYLSDDGKIANYTEYWDVGVIMKAFTGSNLGDIL